MVRSMQSLIIIDGVSRIENRAPEGIIWLRSSVGQNACLSRRRSWVRTPSESPFRSFCLDFPTRIKINGRKNQSWRGLHALWLRDITVIIPDCLSGNRGSIPRVIANSFENSVIAITRRFKSTVSPVIKYKRAYCDQTNKCSEKQYKNQAKMCGWLTLKPLICWRSSIGRALHL